MKPSLKKTIFSLAVVSGISALAITLQFGQAQTAAPAPPPRPDQGPPSMAGKTAAQAFKNIQVLKDIPADQLLPTMQFISASLGVDCEHCHVGRQFEKDDKRPKKTARQMMQMMFAINKDNFSGRREVTCFSCHHGAADPVAIPIISEEEPKPEAARMRPEGMNPASTVPALPAADQILTKYLEGVGGAGAVQKISSRIEKGTISFGGHQAAVEVYAEAPDKRLTVTETPRGQSITAFDGRVGWMTGMGRPRQMTAQETEAFKLDADFYFPAHVKQVFRGFRVRPPQKIGDRETYVVFGFRPGQPRAELYFDKQSGLLIREIRYADTPLGWLPTEIDYADYRDADGVKIPFRWTTARPGGRFTIQVDQVQQNVPIDNAKFAAPAMPAPLAQKPASP